MSIKLNKAILFIIVVFMLLASIVVCVKNIKKDSASEIIETTVVVEAIETIEEIEDAVDVEETIEATETTEAIENKEDTIVIETEETIESAQETTETNETDDDSGLIYLGTFRLTAYCNCEICCGKWAGGATASGVMPKANHTIAVDTSVIPFGTKVVINGKTYVAEDTGSAIYGNRIDIYMDSHSDALQWGVQYADVYIIKD